MGRINGHDDMRPGFLANREQFRFPGMRALDKFQHATTLHELDIEAVHTGKAENPAPCTVAGATLDMRLKRVRRSTPEIDQAIAGCEICTPAKIQADITAPRVIHFSQVQIMTRSKQFVRNFTTTFTCRVPQGKFRWVRVQLFIRNISLFRMVVAVVFHTHFQGEVAAGTFRKLLSGNTDTCRHMTGRIWHHVHDTQRIAPEHRRHDHAGNTRLGIVHIRSRRKDSVKDLGRILHREVPDGRT